LEDDDVVLSAKARKDIIIGTGSSVTKVVVVVVVVVVVASMNRCGGTSVPKRHILLVTPRKKKLVIVVKIAKKGLRFEATTSGPGYQESKFTLIEVVGCCFFLYVVSPLPVGLKTYDVLSAFECLNLMKKDLCYRIKLDRCISVGL
jgi:hypothetical protein